MLKRMKRQGVVIVAVLAAMMLLLALVQVAVATTAASPAPRRAAWQDDPAQPPLAEAIEAAVTWLAETHQNADGGYSSFSAGSDQAPSDVGGTLDALWALGVSGADAGPAMAYLTSNSDQLADYVTQDGSTAAKALLALVAVEDVSDAGAFGDLAANVTSHLSPTGQYGVNTAFNQSLAMLGLAFSGNMPAEEAVTWLV